MPDTTPLHHTELEKELKKIVSFCPGFTLRRAQKTVNRWFEEEFRDAGITSSQYALLITLAVESPLSAGEIARQLSSEISTISRNIQALERLGLVAIAQGADKRRHEARLTDAGRAALADNLPRWKRAQKRTIKRVGTVRWMAMLPGLRSFFDQ